MASKNLDAKFEVIQDTLTNPEFKSKLGRILNEMTPSELAYVIESSPPQERKIIWDLIQLDTEGEVLGELDENLRDDIICPCLRLSDSPISSTIFLPNKESFSLIKSSL